MLERTLVIWSGGFDSTATLLRCCENKEIVDTLYINLANNKEKVEAEKHRRKYMIKRIKNLVVGQFQSRSWVIFSSVHTWSVIPASIAGVTRRVLWIRPKL